MKEWRSKMLHFGSKNRYVAFLLPLSCSDFVHDRLKAGSAAPPLVGLGRLNIIPPSNDL